MRYNALFDRLQNLINRRPSQTEVGSTYKFILTASIRQVKLGYAKNGGAYEQFSKKHANRGDYPV